MKDATDILVPPETTLIDAMRLIGESQQKIVLVVDADGSLLGTVVDGDIRRAILSRRQLDDAVTSIMTTKPITIGPDTPNATIVQLMKRHEVSQLPVVDERNRVIGIELISEMLNPSSFSNWVVLMVGGVGSRLKPLTNDTPKPMLSVGGQPILETILDKFRAQGFQQFYFSVNYKAEVIQSYFGDGAKWGVNIRYIVENQPMGTAGALSLLPEKPGEPVFVMNGDILTSVDFTQLLTFHKAAGADATMCLREYDFEVPFGVATVADQYVTEISEKPVQSFFVNAGIYVLNPDVVAGIGSDGPLDMPDLISGLLGKGQSVSAFPLGEYWLDVGRHQDFEKAQKDYLEIFE